MIQHYVFDMIMHHGKTLLRVPLDARRTAATAAVISRVVQEEGLYSLELSWRE